MISIIICSVDKKLLNDIKNNIAQTIGVEHEIIVIDNTLGKYGLCAAYNLGASQSKFSILCFVHEDVVFKTNNWGGAILKHFTDQSVGVLGVAGSSFKSDIPSSWGIDDEKCNYRNLIQVFKQQKKDAVLDYHNPKLSLNQEVVAIDGLFMALRKSIWEKYHFDQENFCGFHGYDVDFCLQVYKGGECKIVVIFDVLLIHLSEGSFNKDWLLGARQVAHKWRSILPLTSEKISFFDIRFLQNRALEHLISLSLLNNISSNLIFRDLLKYSLTKYFDPVLFIKSFIRIYFPGFYSLLKKLFKKSVNNN